MIVRVHCVLVVLTVALGGIGALGCGSEPPGDVPSDAGVDSDGDGDVVVDAEQDADVELDPAADPGSDASPDAVTDATVDSDASDVLDDPSDDPSGDTQSDVPADVPDADVGPDADVDIDTGTETVDLRGWYGVDQEHIAFVAYEHTDTPPVTECSGYSNVRDGGEIWWVNGAMESLRIFPGTGIGELGFVDATGELSPLGTYGHLGAYDREFTPTSSSLHVCETFDTARHCVVPPVGALCVGGVPPEMIENAQVRTELVETVPGTDTGLRHFALTLHLNEQIADGATDLIVEFSMPVSAETRSVHLVPELEVTGFREVRNWFVQQTVIYEPGDGWVIVEGPRNSLSVSIEGESESGVVLHLWGDFEITETIFTP